MVLAKTAHSILDHNHGRIADSRTRKCRKRSLSHSPKLRLLPPLYIHFPLSATAPSVTTSILLSLPTSTPVELRRLNIARFSLLNYVFLKCHTKAMETAVTSMIDLTGENKNKSQPLLRGIKRVNKSTCVRAQWRAVLGEED